MEIESPSARLMDLLRAELVNVPLDAWGFFFPCHVAVWKFIEVERPGVLGPINARFHGQPVFIGKGATWFCQELGEVEGYFDALEAIMYPLLRNATPILRQKVIERGCFYPEELPDIDPAPVERLAELALHAVDRAVAAGRIA